jgi:sec-independent protein translocase protein TatA
MLGFIGNIGPTELIIVLVIALLVFGRRLPEVGKSLGRGIVEFKKGVKGIDDDIESQSSARPNPYNQANERVDSYRAPLPQQAPDARRVSRADAPEADNVGVEPRREAGQN